MAEWKEYTGSDEQIEEIGDSLQSHGYITKNSDGIESIVMCADTTHYLICETHPYADMIKHWADTGQPVYWLNISNGNTGQCHKYFPPFSCPDECDYSFAPFE